MKNLYYTIVKELDESDGDVFLSGNKNIIIYEIIDNVPKKIKDIFCGIEEESVNVINKHLKKSVYKDYKLNLL
jgi:hypothetical protein